MKRKAFVLAGAALLVISVGASARGSVRDASAGAAAFGQQRDAGLRAVVRDTLGRRVGVVSFRTVKAGVRVQARLSSSAPSFKGFHGFHIHQFGVCDPGAADGPFMSAGGHYAVGNSKHGDHAGDLPSLLVTEDGRARLSFVTDRFSLADLRGKNGSAVMVHAGRDNFANIPDRYTSDGKPGPDDETLDKGDAGSRLACGVIAPQRSEVGDAIRSDVRDLRGRSVGVVSFRTVHGGVRVQARLSSSARGIEGFHGFHIHERGICDPDAAAGPFTSAGGHYAGDGGAHGDHAGDMPSLLVTEDGRARLSFVTDRFTVADLRDSDGSAVMVHAGRDNFANIPDRYTSGGASGPDAATLATGDAGNRLACGVID